MQKLHEQTGNAYQDMQMAISSQAVYIHQHEEIIKRLLSVLSDLSAQVRSLRPDGSGVNRGATSHHEEALSPGGSGGMASTDASTTSNQQNGGSPLQQAQRLMEGYRNLQRPNIQAGIEPFHNMAPQEPQEGGGGAGYDGGYPQNGQGISSINGMHGVDQPGQHMFPGITNTFNNDQTPGQVGWQETPPPQASGTSSAMGTPGRPAPTRKRSTPNTPQWRQSPRVLLVEDDPTCRRIGSKFLTGAQCIVDIAVSYSRCAAGKCI
jgi:osomolarity two-component system response regulator SKN7